MATGKYPSAAYLRWKFWARAESGTSTVRWGIDHVCGLLCDWLEYKRDSAFAKAARKYSGDNDLYEFFMQTPKEQREKARLRIEAMERAGVCVICQGTGRVDGGLAALKRLDGD